MCCHWLNHDNNNIQYNPYYHWLVSIQICFSCTVFILYNVEPLFPDLIVNDYQLQSVNISWSPLHGHYVTVYTLSVTSSEIGPQSFPLDTPYFTFTAPEGAPPCEVYNFSVTATYDIVGATYTGAGCSVPSPVLSRMLPSLPNVTKLESSLDYSLELKSGGITLKLLVVVR